MKPILLLGGGGHCHACVDVIEVGKTFKVIGIVLDTIHENLEILGYPVLGTDLELPKLLADPIAALVTVGQTKTPMIRIKLFEQLKSYGASLPVVCSPNAYVSTRSEIGEGTIVMHGSVLNSNSRIGENCILNTKCLIEHDVTVGDHCHIATGVRLNGGVNVGDGSFVGSGVVVKHGVRIGKKVVIEAGQVVLRDVPDGTWLRGGL
jgi:sugar O-acyltransferase (sialic acid O-acetyltransferase NeuD family)